MSYIRNPRIKRIVSAIQTIEASPQNEYLHNVGNQNLHSRETSPSLLESDRELLGVNIEQHPENESMPVISMCDTSLSATAAENCLPSCSRPRSDSSSSSTSTSSSTSSSSSSSSSTSSGKDFSPDDADQDPDYVEQVAPRRRITTSSSSSSLQHDNGIQQLHVEELIPEPVPEVDSIQMTV